jgi:hypothetical protein
LKEGFAQPVELARNGLSWLTAPAITALDVILDKAYPGHRVSAETVLHFGPPAAILLASETRDFYFVGMPAGASI